MTNDPAREENSPPAWQLLPDDPVGFFGLQAGFDRKDLKRAYNTLLRRYKPDKFPQEFQKLRAAFEQLDGELRYGETPHQPSSSLGNYQWNPSAIIRPATPSDPDQAPLADPVSPGPDSLGPDSLRPDSLGPESTGPASLGPASLEPDKPTADDASRHSNNAVPQPASGPSAPAPAPKTLQARIESESLPQLYDELKQNPREPYDFYVLALLSDAVADPEHLVFLRWLMSGIKAFPGHPALTQLLTAYFQDGDLPDDQLASVLVRVSQVVRNDRFYFLTEKLFDRLALTAPWPKVEQVLNQCSANINDHNIRARVVFTCHLLRRALWLAPLDKCQEMLAYINNNFEFLEGSLEYEQELNSLLLNYVQVRERFVTKGPLAQMIDEALRKYCLDIDGRGDFEVVKAQAHIAQHPQQLFREFRLTPAEDMQLLIPWIWLSDEVEDRLETQEQPFRPDRLMTATFHMMQQIDENFPLSPIQFYNLLDRGLPLAICLSLAIGLPVVVGITTDAFWPSMANTFVRTAFICGVVLSVVYWFWLRKRTTSVWLINYLRRMIEKQYLLWWRSILSRFFAATHFTYRDVDRAIDGVLETRRSELNISNWLPHFYSRDPALYVYAAAVRFLR